MVLFDNFVCFDDVFDFFDDDGIDVYWEEFVSYGVFICILEVRVCLFFFWIKLLLW